MIETNNTTNQQIFEYLKESLRLNIDIDPASNGDAFITINLSLVNPEFVKTECICSQTIHFHDGTGMIELY